MKSGLLYYYIKNKPDEALEYDAKRWQIETLFRTLKMSGFNLKDTHLKQPEGLEK